jgi:hypothetical protein
LDKSGALASTGSDFCSVAQAALSMTLPFTARSSTNATDARELINAGLSRQEATCLLVANLASPATEADHCAMARAAASHHTGIHKIL